MAQAEASPRLSREHAVTGLTENLTSLGVPADWAGLLAALTAAVLLVTFVAVSALFFIWLERKVAGRIQDRLGPTRVGPFGMLQTLADGIKLLSKEDLVPAAADPILFRIAPYIAFCGSFVAYVALPFARDWVAMPLSVTLGVMLVLAILSTEVFGVLLAGYSSGSKRSLYGGMREAAQMIAYEIPLGLSVLVPVLIAGTMDLNAIAGRQKGTIVSWQVFHDPFAFVAFGVFFICGLAACKRAPFDLAEAESELVGGFHTEYSGLRWSFFFMAEYATMFLIAALAVLLFLGGWHTGVLWFDLSESLGFFGNVLNAGVLILKAWLLVFVMMWIRWSLPRLRIDQVMTTCLHYLLPIACVLLLGAAVWRIGAPRWLADGTPFVLAGLTVAGVVWFLYCVVATRGTLPTAFDPASFTQKPTTGDGA